MGRLFRIYPLRRPSGSFNQRWQKLNLPVLINIDQTLSGPAGTLRELTNGSAAHHARSQTFKFLSGRSP
jgi:hypothetical protein